MNELFELFAEITSRYLELTQDPNTTPCMRIWGAIVIVVRGHGFVILTESHYSDLVEGYLTEKSRGIAK